ncbi:MAG: DNA topoisomerase IB [Steroidobacteraceae bacterium]
MRRARDTARLVYTSGGEPGIRRVRRGRGFAYWGCDGRRICGAADLDRIRRLAIPPAYRDVWICADPRGHLQATGRDARRRKQYRYHPAWRAHRDSAKFERILEFARSLPAIRRRVAHDLRGEGLSRSRVLATVVRLLESTLMRVGNEAYARENGSYGLTTLRNRHVHFRGADFTFEFRAKSGIRRRVCVHDEALSRIVRRCADIPGQELFQWQDEAGELHRVDSMDVNEYLREAAGGPFTAKDFRTWFATLHAMQELRGRRAASARAVKHEVAAALVAVSARLGNTPAVCRKSYVHPQVLAAFADGRLARLNGASPLAALRSLVERPEPGAAGEAKATRRASPGATPTWPGARPCRAGSRRTSAWPPAAR